jgi:hypothetical protein
MQTVVTTKLIDRYPFHGIPAGERGTVIDTDEETGHISPHSEVSRNHTRANPHSAYSMLPI